MVSVSARGVCLARAAKGAPRAVAAFAAVALLIVSLPCAAQSIQASVDRRQISTDEDVTLRLLVQDALGANVGQLEGNDFVVVGQSFNSSRTVLNGRSQAVTRVSLTLRPTRTGDLTIGRVPVRVGSSVRYSDPIQVRVTQGRRPAVATPRAARGAPRAPNGVVAESPASPPPPPRPGGEGMPQTPMGEVARGEPLLVGLVTSQDLVVGGQLIVDYLLLTPRMTFGLDAVELTEPEWGNVWFREMTDARTGGRNRLGNTELNGQSYEVQLIRSYVVVPLEAGAFPLPPLSLELEVNSFRQRGRYTVSTEPLEIRVTDPPEDAPDGFDEAHVGRFELRVTADRPRARAGEAVQLSVHLEGSALFSRIRGPELPDLAGADVLEPNDESRVGHGPNGWIEGSWTRRVTLVPTREGTLQIPSLAFTYFDPFLGRYETIASEAIELAIEGETERQVLPEAVAVGTEWAEALPEAPRVSASPPRPPSRLYASPVFVLATTAAPLSWLAWLIGRTLRRRRDARAPERTRALAGDTARTQLRSLDGNDATRVGEILREYLSQRLDEPVRGARVAALERVVASSYGEELAQRCSALVQRAELARYSGDGDASALADEALALIDAMEDA